MVVEKRGRKASTSMDEGTTLRMAKQALDAGDKTTARNLILQVIRQNPRNETAWLWLSALVGDPQKERDSLEQVLKINPSNATARKHLDRLDHRLTQSVPHTPPPFPEAVAVPREEERDKSVPPVQRRKPGLRLSRGIIGLAIIAAMLACICVIAVLIRVPVATPEPTPTFPPTWTPLPTADVGNEWGAWEVCENFVKDELVAPRTAKFLVPERAQIDSETDTWLIVGEFDSQNRMGAMIRATYICQVTYLGGNQ